MNIDVTKMDKLRVLKKTELQELLVHYKLKKTGNKPQLFERLLDYYNENPVEGVNFQLVPPDSH